MIIRREQLRAFETYMRQSFEERMVAHMAQAYPTQFAEHGGERENATGPRALVRRAVAGAARIGAKTEGSIQQYLEIMLEISPDFASDESMAWACDILGDETLAGETRILLIHRKLPVQALTEEKE